MKKNYAILIAIMLMAQSTNMVYLVGDYRRRQNTIIIRTKTTKW